MLSLYDPQKGVITTGIYIKGMKMPESCWNCDIGCSEYSDDIGCPFYDLEYVDQRAYKGTRHEGCPIRNVPAHGDLIDRDKLRTYTVTRAEIIDGEIVEKKLLYADDVFNAPTIIEAEVEEE